MIFQLAEGLLFENEYEVSSVHILQLVNSSACTACDCEFVALAKFTNITLITADKKIIKAFPDIAQTIDEFIA